MRLREKKSNRTKNTTGEIISNNVKNCYTHTTRERVIPTGENISGQSVGDKRHPCRDGQLRELSGLIIEEKKKREKERKRKSKKEGKGRDIEE